MMVPCIHITNVHSRGFKVKQENSSFPREVFILSEGIELTESELLIVSQKKRLSEAIRGVRRAKEVVGARISEK